MRSLSITATAGTSAAFAVAGGVVLLATSGGIGTGLGIVLLGVAGLVLVLGVLTGVVAGSEVDGDEHRNPGSPGP